MPALLLSYRIPTGIDSVRGQRRILWQRSDGERFTDPFFEDTQRRLERAGFGRVDATALDEWSTTPDAWPPVTVILHVSRCGSTLLSRMLAAIETNLVISEARVIDAILRPGPGKPSAGIEERAVWLRHAAAAFAASQRRPPARLILKLDCWHIFELDTIRLAFPDSPLLFVHRSPLEVLVSLARRPSLTLVRDTVSPAEIGVTRAARDAMSQVELAAAILGAFFREAIRHRRHLVPVPYESLPAFAWTDFPGPALSPVEIQALKAVAGYDAKNPGETFAPDSDRKRAEATLEIREACARLADSAYASLRDAFAAD